MIKHDYYLIDQYGNKTPVGKGEGDIWYILKTIKAPRSINSKADRKAEELLALGMNTKKMQEYCIKHKVNLIHERSEENE